MKNLSFATMVCMVTFLVATFEGDAAATIPTGAGPYKWADYLPTGGGRADARPVNGLTADQTWIVETARKANPFFPGVQTLNDYWQIWTGESVTSTSGDGFRVMKGNVVFENAVISQTKENYIGYTGPVRLVLRNGGSLTATAAGIQVGRSYNSGTAGTGTVYMEEPSMLCGAGQYVDVGVTLPGALWMDGGLVTLTNNVLYVGDSASGYLRQNDGTVSMRGDGNAVALYLGYGTSQYSSIHVAGGTFTTRRTGYANVPSVLLGKGAGTVDFYADGGKVLLPNERVAVGYWDSGTSGTARFTVDGTAELDLGLLGLGIGANVAGKAIVNLNGGHLYPEHGLAGYGNTNPIRQLNFDGGTIQGTTTGQMDVSWPTTVYPGGGAIEVKSSKSDVHLSPRLATGYGVGAITLTNPGSGYVTAPEVTISGGSGSGATAYAVMNKDRTIGRIVVTCRGEGYAADDQLTVTISSTTGSGAAAQVSLAANGTGTLRKIGGGVWHQAKDSAFDGDLVVEEGTIAVDGASFTSLKSLAVRNGASLDVGRSGESGQVRDAAVNRVDFKDGMGYLGRYGDVGIGRLTIGTITLDRAVANVNVTNDQQYVLTDTSLTATSTAESPIVHGLVYQHRDSSGYRSPSLFQRGEDGALSLITTTVTPDNDANFCPNAGISSAEAPEITSLNCAILPLSPGVECYLKNTGLLEIKSGMIICRRPHECVVRLEVTGGGAFTTRAPGGMILYSDMREVSRRSYSQAHDSAAHLAGWRRIYGPFADPDATTPMALTVAGESQTRPERGAVAWLLNKNSFSGGLNLINGGVVVNGDESLGKAGAPIDAIGPCSITAYNWTFAIGARPLTIHEDAALMFCPSYGNQGNTVAATLMGTGDLLTSDIDRSGYAIAYTGDHSAFEGIYYIMGHAHISPETFGPKARIFLADGTNGVGVVETSGEIMRPFGLMTPGAVAWHKHRSMPHEYGLRGGFAAKGGDLTVNLGGEGAALVPGADYLPEGAVIQLQSQYADSELTVENGLDLAGKTQEVSVWSGKTAKWAGELKDSVGGGMLKVTGGGAFVFGGSIQAKIGPDGFEGHPVAVDGNLTLDGATVELDATDADLEKLSGQTIPLVSVTGTISGKFERATSNPHWIVRTRAHGVELVERKGMCCVIR